MNAHFYFKCSPVAVAVSVAMASFPALADDVADLISPNQAEVSIGISNASGVDGLYRQYSGVGKSGAFGGLGAKYIDRDDSGRWLRLEAINLGTKNQEFQISAEKQADWILGASYDELTRYSYLDFQSNNTGLGSTSVLPGAGAFGDVPTLNTKRESLSLLGTKYLGPSTSFTASVKSEEKTGLRVAGYNGYVFSPEPINHKHTQFNASIEHASKTYQLSAGYYGSVFKNANQSVAYNNPTLANTVSLPSDNFFYSVYLDGAYQFTDDTRGTVRASYSKATQDEATRFFPATAVNTGQTVGSLAGRVDNIELYGSLSSRLTKETKLLATWKFEKKDDKTPYLWFVAGDQDARTRPESGLAHARVGQVERPSPSGVERHGGDHGDGMRAMSIVSRRPGVGPHRTPKPGCPRIVRRWVAEAKAEAEERASVRAPWTRTLPRTPPSPRAPPSPFPRMSRGSSPCRTPSRCIASPASSPPIPPGGACGSPSGNARRMRVRAAS